MARTACAPINRGGHGRARTLREATPFPSLGRKNTVETVDGERHGGRLVLAYGTGTVRPQDHQLVLEAAAEDFDSLAHVEDVLARHLERFGAKRQLVMTWQRGSAGGADGIGG